MIKPFLLIFFLVSLFFLAIAILIYNHLVARKNCVEYAFSAIDVMLKKRADLVPRLVSTVKGYMTHEKEVLAKITEIRAQAISPELKEKQRFEKENILSALLSHFMITVENYPILKSNENFLQLQAALNEIEEQIAAARRAYNASVFNYNNSIEIFPSKIIADMAGYKKKIFFEIPEEEKASPKINTGTSL